MLRSSSEYLSQPHTDRRSWVQCKNTETIASIQTDYDSMFGDSATEERQLESVGKL
jgi:hypothetical protein